MEAQLDHGLAPAPRARGMWDPDEPFPPVGKRALRAALVGLVWAVAVLPTALGWQRCVFATLLKRPCPGCGMTRAVRLLAAGDVSGSLHMHPLAVPVLGVGVLFVAATVWSTFDLGSPVHIHRSRFAQWTVGAMIGVYAVTVLFWIARWLGFFGGPVPVY
jgi:hypothetical protein